MKPFSRHLGQAANLREGTSTGANLVTFGSPGCVKIASRKSAKKNILPEISELGVFSSAC